MIFKLTYILFFIASFIYGSLQIAGPITPRHIMTIVMLVMCFREGMPKLDKYMVVFMVFVGCYLFSGVVQSADFVDTLKWAIAQHFVCIVGYQATRILVEKYDGVRWMLFTYLGIGLLDALVTIGQYHIGPYADAIMKLVNNNLESSQLDSAQNHGVDTMAGYVPPGIVGSVQNGYLLAATCILSLYNKKLRPNLINIGLLCFSLYALYCAQEKTAFVAGSVLSFFLIYKLLMSLAGDNLVKKSMVNIGFASFIFLAVVGAITIIAMDDQSRYAAGFEMTEERNDLLSNAVRFIGENPFGGIYEFNRQNHDLPPHNLFLNAFVLGGYLGGLCIMILLIWKCKIMVKTLWQKIYLGNYHKYICTLVYLSFTLSSVTHNGSFAMGDFYFWTFWAVCLYQYCGDKSNSYVPLTETV